MDGWGSVEELVGHAFGRSPVVTANEAHSGLDRCVRTRQVGQRMVRAAHRLGVRRLAMEALYRQPDGSTGPIRELPDATAGYLAQPDMRALIGTALELGWSLWAYEADFRREPEGASSDPLDISRINWREREQALNLLPLVEHGGPLLIWCGNGHATKTVIDDWVPMGYQLATIGPVEPFVIDQAVGLRWPSEDDDEPFPLRAPDPAVLGAYGGTAAILRDQAPEPFDRFVGVDAVILSTDNEFVSGAA